MWLFPSLVFVSRLYFSESVDNRIYPQNICVTDSGLLNCTCKNEEDLTVYEITDDSVDALEVHDCGHVIIEPVAFPGLHFQYVTFNNILLLDLKTDAFKNVGSLEFLELANIVSFKTFTNSVETVNTGKVLLLNVTCENVKPYSFHLEGVTHFLISNSSFGTVESAGFRLHNPQFVFIINTKVENLLTGAIQMNGTGFQVFFQKSNFVLAQQQSFYFESLQFVTFQGCEFQNFYPGAMFGHVMNFLFFGNTIVNMESSVFTSLNASYLFWFKENRILNSYPGALNFDLDNVPNVTIANNTFTCNCDTLWLMEPKYKMFQASSFCETDTGNVHMTDLNFKDIKSQCEDSQTIDTINSDTYMPSSHGSENSQTTDTINSDAYMPSSHGSENSQTTDTINSDTYMPSLHESIASKTGTVILDIWTIITSVLFCTLPVFWF